MNYQFLFVGACEMDTIWVSNSLKMNILAVKTKDVSDFRKRYFIEAQKALNLQLGSYNPDFWENFHSRQFKD